MKMLNNLLQEHIFSISNFMGNKISSKTIVKTPKKKRLQFENCFLKK